MFDFKKKKWRICFFGMLISVAILLIVFSTTDGLLGDKEFSEYTPDDWAIAIVPLSVIVISLISGLVFALIIIVPMIWLSPVLIDYVTNKKFADIEPETEFFAFDHNEFKRACCRREEQNGIWFSVKEYNLKTRRWTSLEEGRYIENADDLTHILKEEYMYDKVKIYNR